MERLLGLENEYAFHATGPRGGAVNSLEALGDLNAIAAAELVSLPSLHLMSLDQAEAITRQMPFLQPEHHA